MEALLVTAMIGMRFQDGQNVSYDSDARVRGEACAMQEMGKHVLVQTCDRMCKAAFYDI